MNFISHFRGAMDKFRHDDRHMHHHVALYFGLFHHWNLNRFEIPMQVARDDIMRSAGIRTQRIFYRCLKDLDAWGYLRYEPTRDPHRTSQVHMYPFDRNNDAGNAPGDQVKDDVKDQVRDQVTDQVRDQVKDQPFTNSIINNTNKKKQLNGINEYEHTHKNPNQFNDRQQPDQKQNYSRGDSRRESVDRNQSEKNGNKAGGGAGPGGVPGTFEEIEAFFAEKKQNTEQATRFFNYYSNLGWRIGNNGRLMEDWRFAANNWIINIKRFDHEPELKPGALHIPPDRDYQQPL